LRRGFHSDILSPTMQSIVLVSVIASASAGSAIPLSWNDCSDETYKTTIKSLTPDSVEIGAVTTITGTGTLLEDVSEDINFEGQLELKLEDCTGDAGQSKTCKFPLNTGTIGFQGFEFPVKAGEIPVEVDLKISKILPADALTSVAEISAVSASKGLIFCLNAYTKKSPDSHFGVGILDVTWSDCGGSDALVTVDSLTPNQIRQGQDTKFVGTGNLPTDIEEDDITFTTKLKVQLLDCKGKASDGAKCNLPLALGYLQFAPLPSPVHAGDVPVSVDLKLSSLVPSSIVDSTTHVQAKTLSGENVFCLNVVTTPSAGIPVAV